ncbi:hypothetical protein HZA96_00230 [Candidatus Woesearchaeota archaeon]|nr:hypothetical protein [Candidatus Woesearchaeota archaeon]
MSFKKMRLFAVTLFLLVILSISSVIVSATLNFDMQVNPIIKNFYPTQQGKHEITIINKEAIDDQYTLSFTNTPRWSIETEPLSYLSGITLKPNSSVTFSLYITPVPEYDFGPHDFNIIVTSKNTGSSIVDILPVLLRNPSKDFTEYSPVINLDVDIPNKINPKEEATIEIDLLNRNKLDIKNLTVVVASKYFSTVKETTLAPLEKKTERISINYDPLMQPTKDTMIVTVYANGVDFKPAKKEIEIIGYSILKENVQKEDSFLKYTRSITYTNDGNVANKKKLVVTTSVLEQLFSSTTPDAVKVVDNGVREYAWEVVVQPQQSVTLTMVTNYRYIVFILIGIILLIVSYYLFRSPMLITKESRVVKASKTDEGISHLKVLIHIKNRTNKVVEHVKIIDRVPHIAELEKEYSVGTLHPDKVVHHELKGTLVKWELPVVEPYEERIISYNIKSKLKILGTLTLPAATLKYKNNKGNEVKISSNRFIAGSEEE